MWGRRPYKEAKGSYYGHSFGIPLGVFTIIYGLCQISVFRNSDRSFFVYGMTIFNMVLIALYGIAFILYAIAIK